MTTPIVIIIPNVQLPLLVSSALVIKQESNISQLPAVILPSENKKEEELAQLTYETEQQQKKVKNRVYAKAYQKRKKAKMSNLEDQVQSLKAEMAALKNEYATLKVENDFLKMNQPSHSVQNLFMPSTPLITVQDVSVASKANLPIGPIGSDGFLKKEEEDMPLDDN